MNIYKKHAMQEFRIAGWLNENNEFDDEMQEAICKHVLALLDVFAAEGHSGTTAPYALNMFKRLANFETLTPIMCTEDEWNEVGENKYQNTRLSAVFKDGEDGKPYYINAIVFREEDGSCFTGSCEGVPRRQYIRLPFVPKTFYVDVNSWEVNKDDERVKEPGSGWWKHSIADKTQLAEVFAYYDSAESLGIKE